MWASSEVHILSTAGGDGYLSESGFGVAFNLIQNLIIQKDTCTPMFIVALFTIARTWKQPKCPSADEWIKKMRSIYAKEYYSAIKRNGAGSFVVSWVGLETDYHKSEVRKRKTKQISYINTCV